MYVANVKMTAVTTVVVEEWERPGCGDQITAVSVCVVEGVQNACAMTLIILLCETCAGLTLEIN